MRWLQYCRWTTMAVSRFSFPVVRGNGLPATLFPTPVSSVRASLRWPLASGCWPDLLNMWDILSPPEDTTWSQLPRPCSWVPQRNLITEGFNVQLTRFPLTPCQRRQCVRGWRHHLLCHRHQSQRCWGNRNFPERSPLSNWGWMNGS